MFTVTGSGTSSLEMEMKRPFFVNTQSGQNMKFVLVSFIEKAYQRKKGSQLDCICKSGIKVV